MDSPHSRLPINTPKLTVGYQIPGFLDYQSGCDSAAKTGNTTEVGTVISQGIRYNNLRAWYHEYTTWEKENKQVNHYQNDSYESAVDGGSLGSWGHQTNLKKRRPVPGSKCTPTPNGCSRPKEDYYIRKYIDDTVSTRSDGQDTYLEKKSSVYTPYNFNTSIHSYIESSEGGVGFIGSKINISANYGVTPRENTLISKTPYATHTRPDQTVKVYEMIVDENYPESKLQEETRTNNTICNGTEHCNLVDEFSRTINTSGNFSGEKK